MNQERQVELIPRKDTNALVEWLQEAMRQARLAWRLFWDQRVPLWTKLIPPAVLAYVISPIDIIPDVALGLGQLDDIAVLLLGLKLFIELAPPEVVREHLLALGARIKEWRVVGEDGEPSVVIDGNYEVKEAEALEAEVEKT